MHSPLQLQTPPGRPRELVPGVSYIGQSLSGVPEDEATIEAEGGETALGDLNGDGMLEHMRINGPKHRQGGVPLDVDPGTFLFSDAKSLRIKDEGTLARFTKGASKKGFTPAEIARQYDINTHVNTLKDDTSTAIAKRTAQLMLDTNLAKLSELALLQESMKGFPNGVPDFAAALLPPELADQVAPGEEEQPMEFGGSVLPRFQNGGRHNPTSDTTKFQRSRGYNSPEAGVSDQPVVAGSNGNVPTPRVGQQIYVNGKPLKVSRIDSSRLASGGAKQPYIAFENGVILNKNEWQQLHSGKSFSFNKDAGADVQFDAGKHIEDTDSMERFRRKANDGQSVQIYSLSPKLPSRKLNDSVNLRKGDYLMMNDAEYEVLDPHGENDNDGYLSSMKAFRDVFDDTKGIVKVKNKKTKQIEFLEGEDITDYANNAPEYFKHVDSQLHAQQRAAVRQQKKAAPVQTPVPAVVQPTMTKLPAAATAFQQKRAAQPAHVNPAPAHVQQRQHTRPAVAHTPSPPTPAGTPAAAPAQLTLREQFLQMQAQQSQ